MFLRRPERFGRVLCLFTATLFIFVLNGMAQDSGTVKGVITNEQGNPLIGANVYLEGTILGSATDVDGTYFIMNVPGGDYTAIVEYVGYKSQKSKVSVGAGESVTQNFTLEDDVLGLDAVVVTGTANPLRKIESSVAIATVNEVEIAQRAPRNTADLLKAIPGFYVESSGGEGGNNLFARGIPADGSFRYVSLQEDGLPVFEDGELMFGNADLFLRVDETVRRMEAVRGGTGSIFASNAPGGIINFISKTGGPTFKGIAKLSLGDYGMYRTDLNIGGPLGEDWRFNIGGFYRYDEGIRAPGFTANAGGQIKGNITRFLDNGYIRGTFKFLDDRNIFYLPIPLQNPDDPEEIDGFDANYGTMTSLNMIYLSVPTPKGESFSRNLEEGMHPKIMAIGGELGYEFEGGWKVKNNFRFTKDDQIFNAIFSLSDPSSAIDYAQGILDDINTPDMRIEGGDTTITISPYQGLATGFEYLDSRTGEVINKPGSMNGNGLIANVGWWSVTLPKSNFANDLQLSNTFGEHNLTLGFYHTDWKVSSLWYWQDVLADVRGGEDDEITRSLDIVLVDANGKNVVSVTDNGLSKIGSFYQAYSLDAVTNAVFFNDEFGVTDQLRIDAGIRYEDGEVTGFVENTSSFDLGDPTTLADDAVTYGDNTFNPYDFDYDEFAWSVGANLKLSDALAVFGRFSDGFRTPDDQQFVFNDPKSFKVEQVLQAEGGVKYSSPNLAIFASAFWIKFENIPFSDEVVNPTTGDIERAFRFADSRTIGAEVEAIVKVGNFSVDFTGTLQDPEFQQYDFGSVNISDKIETRLVNGTLFDVTEVAAETLSTDISFEGNRIRRIPRIFFDVRPSLKIADLTLYGNYHFFGERFVDDANNNKLPSWGGINAGATYRLGDFMLAVNGSNLTNTIGLTEGNPRAGQVIGTVKNIYMARPIMGRSFIGSVIYNF